MMLSLNCLILGQAFEKSLTENIGETYTDDSSVVIRFSKFTVSNFKEKLFRRGEVKDIVRNTGEMDLWKVDSKKVEEEKNNLKEFTVDDIKDKLGGVMMIGQNKLKSYFDKMSEEEEEGIHVFIVSTSTVPFAKTISLARLEKEVQNLFEIYSQDLEKVATNKYDPYEYFEAPDEHPYKSEIDKKKIPMLGGNPNLLLYNLPRKNEDCLTNCEHLETDLKRNIVSNFMTIVMGTSGCGKTRLCLELLCRNYGLYFVAVPLSFGAMDLSSASEWTKNEIHGKEPDEAKKLAERAVWSCVTARLVLLNHLFEMAEKLKCVMEPKSWLIFQLSHQLVNLLPVKFRDMVDEEALKEYRLNITKSIDNKIKNFFPIIYDEAQYHTSYLSDAFTSYNNKTEKRPLFTIVIRIFQDLFSIFPKAIVCITGSGLSLMEAKELALSNVAKTEPSIPIFQTFGQIKTPEAILKLARSIFPLKDEYALMAIKWLKGRYRFTWTWIHYLLNSYDPKGQLEKLVDHLTTDYENPRNLRFGLYSGLVRLVHHPNERHSYIKHGSILELIKRAIIYYAMTGRGFVYDNTKEIDIMSVGFAHLETRELTGVIDEPIAIQAGINYFEKTNKDDMWLNLMSQVNFNASMPGIIWEKCVANSLHDNLFKSNTALSSHKKLFPDKSYPPVEFNNSPELLPTGKNRVGVKSVELSTPKEYIEWLRIVSSWEKTGKVSDGFCPICYPPNTAGPDISIAFYFPKGKKRVAYILNVQVKLRNNVELKKACKTVNPETMFTDKNLNPGPSHNELREIYKQQNWDTRNIQMIVAYPCNFKRKRDYQETPGASKRKRKIPRVIIDETNADILISRDRQKWVINLKNEQGSEVDWECSDIEYSEDEE